MLDRQRAKAAGGRSISCVGGFPGLIRCSLVSTLNVQVMVCISSEFQSDINSWILIVRMLVKSQAR
jgi:hypothetical protein